MLRHQVSSCRASALPYLRKCPPRRPPLPCFAQLRHPQAGNKIAVTPENNYCKLTKRCANEGRGPGGGFSVNGGRSSPFCTLRTSFFIHLMVLERSEKAAWRLPASRTSLIADSSEAKHDYNRNVVYGHPPIWRSKRVQPCITSRCPKSPSNRNSNINIESDSRQQNMSEPTEEDLLAAVKESLQKDGRLGRFKAELRSAVMSILNRNSVPNKEVPVIPEETKLINDLVREYLAWNGYIYAEQLLVAESGQSKEQPLRESIASKLGVMDDSRTTKIPLLYYIVSAFQNHEDA